MPTAKQFNLFLIALCVSMSQCDSLCVVTLDCFLCFISLSVNASIRSEVLSKTDGAMLVDHHLYRIQLNNRLARSATIFHHDFLRRTVACLAPCVCCNNIDAFSVCRRSSAAAAAAAALVCAHVFRLSLSIHPSIRATGKPDRFEGEISFEQRQRDRARAHSFGRVDLACTIFNSNIFSAAHCQQYVLLV